MVYVPQHFAETDEKTLADFIRRYGFATLVSTGPAGLIASHIPLLYEPVAGSPGRLIGHLSRLNPQLADLAGGREALAIFHGPHAYVSPSWYATQPSVPTWNYAVIHAYGAVEAITGEDALVDIVDRLSRVYEAGNPTPWRLADQPDRYIRGMVRGIGAFALSISRLEGKFKLSQNRDAVDRERVVIALDASGDPGAQDVAALMNPR